MIDFHEKPFEVEKHNTNRFEQGKKQWEVLDSIILKYEGQPINFTRNNKFIDQEWTLDDEDNTGIHWGKHLNPKYYLPMQVYLKALMVYLIEVEQMAYKSVVGGMTSFMSQFVPVLEAYGAPILKATKNSPWLGLVSLEANDITLVLDKIAIDNSRSGEATPRILNYFEKTQMRVEEGFHFFASGFITPWTLEGIVYSKWLTQQKERHNLVQEKKPFSPFSDETVAGIIEPAMKFLDGITVTTPINSNNATQDLIELTPSDLKAPIVSILNAVKEVRKTSTHCQCVKLINYDNEFNKLMIEHKNYIDELHPISAKNRVNRPVAKLMHNTILKQWFSDFFQLTQTAAIWILAMSTGLRNVDIRLLDSTTCLQYSAKFKIWYVRAELKKTKNTILIPVGEPAVKAIKLLNWLRPLEANVLIQIKVFLFNDTYDGIKNPHMGGNTLNTRLKAFASHFNVNLDFGDGDEGTAHCIRATLAGYIGRHSVLAVLILKKLFGHSNNLMPDQYIHHNVLVKKQRAQQLERMHSNTAHQIARSIANKEVAGTKGDELLAGAKKLETKIRLENKSLNEMQVHRKLIDVLVEIILNDINNEQTQTLLTPVGVICMRATNHSADSPCATNINKAERDRAGVSRAMFSALPQLPNPSQCIGLDCPDALATKTHSIPLLEQFDWYTNVLRQCTDETRDMDEDAQHFVDTYYPIIMANNMLADAISFRKKYGPALRTLYGDIKSEGYFDV
ncbi:hypothetical protein [Glaciecola sp. SC05]|uniref:hypothetical protein n=1 Tax=Glaciecola sp. SC05 TaxID=1987355 RepID=UPI003528277A